MIHAHIQGYAAYTSPFEQASQTIIDISTYLSISHHHLAHLTDPKEPYLQMKNTSGQRIHEIERESNARKFVKAAPLAPARGYYPQTPSPAPRIDSSRRRMPRGGPGDGFPRRRFRFRARARSRSCLVASDVVKKLVQRL